MLEIERLLASVLDFIAGAAVATCLAIAAYTYSAPKQCGHVYQPVTKWSI